MECSHDVLVSRGGRLNYTERELASFPTSDLLMLDRTISNHLDSVAKVDVGRIVGLLGSRQVVRTELERRVVVRNPTAISTPDLLRLNAELGRALSTDMDIAPDHVSMKRLVAVELHRRHESGTDATFSKLDDIVSPIRLDD